MYLLNGPIMKLGACVMGVSTLLSVQCYAQRGDYRAPKNAYQYEVAIGYDNLHWPDIETTNLSGEFTYYTQPVRPAKVPLLETAFVARASSLTFSVSDKKTKFDRFIDYDLYSDLFELRGRFILGEDFIFTASYGTGDDEDVQSIGGGAYLDSGVSLEFEISERSQISVPTGYIDLDGKKITYKKVAMEPDGSGSRLVGSYMQEDGDNDFELETMEVEYMYFTNISAGFGAVYKTEESDFAEVKSKALKIEWASSPFFMFVFELGEVEEEKGFDFVGTGSDHTGAYGELDVIYRF